MSTAECGRIGPIRHKNCLLEQIEDLSVICKQRKSNSESFNKNSHDGSHKLDQLV